MRAASGVGPAKYHVRACRQIAVVHAHRGVVGLIGHAQQELAVSLSATMEHRGARNADIAKHSGRFEVRRASVDVVKRAADIVVQIDNLPAASTATAATRAT